jgi:hypothetical protein
MEVGVDEDGSGFLSDYELEPTGGYEGGGSGENVTSTFLMPWPQRSAWIGIFALMLVVAIAGNALVAWIVLGWKSTTPIFLIEMKLYVNGFFFSFLLKTAHRRMKTVTNYFLVSRSLSLHLSRGFTRCNSILLILLWKTGEPESGGSDYVPV